MKIEEHTQLIQDIMTNIADPTKVTTLLADLSKDYGEISTTIKDYETKVPLMEKDMEDIRRANMKLFQQVGAPPQDNPTDDKPPVDKPIENKPPVDPFKNLFNEKGELI